MEVNHFDNIKFIRLHDDERAKISDDKFSTQPI
jgi:hypothetical protein